jgi:predicted unusual protein kinase regulating ubiquinone biosynthesis (AarF/ABC1/UbiB family)
MIGTSFRPHRLTRYKDIVLLLTKYARGGSIASGARPAELAADLERLGPTFIKLGQLLSTRPDLLPQADLEALSRLQDEVEPISFSEVERIIESELGVRPDRIFLRIDAEPVAAASLAQIHRAELRSGGIVAVKVQRPGLREIIVDDMAVIGEAATFLDRHTSLGRRYEFSRILEEFRIGLLRELDFTREAANLRTLSANLVRFDRIVVPAPHESYSSSRVLTMDFIPGRKITALGPLALNEADGPVLADQLFRAYLKQVLVDGFFHADPHPGNVLLGEDGRLVLLDLGMVGRVGADLKQELLCFLLAVGDGRSDDAAGAAIKIGRKREGFAEGELRRKISGLVLDNDGATVSQMDFGRILLELARFSGDYGLLLPPELALIGKALSSLDKIVATLDPRYDPGAAVRDESAGLLRARLEGSISMSSVVEGLMDVQKFTERLPQRLNKALDVLGGNELHVKVDAVDEQLLLQGMQKIANRIALGLLLASLIIGAALLMRIETSFRVLGYPGVAILLFLGAAAASLALVVDIIYYDDKRRFHLPRRGSGPDTK